MGLLLAGGASNTGFLGPPLLLRGNVASFSYVLRSCRPTRICLSPTFRNVRLVSGQPTSTAKFERRRDRLLAKTFAREQQENKKEYPCSDSQLIPHVYIESEFPALWLWLIAQPTNAVVEAERPGCVELVSRDVLSDIPFFFLCFALWYSKVYLQHGGSVFHSSGRRVLGRSSDQTPAVFQQLSRQIQLL